ncbi:MAG TPA: hypothetical protein VFH06_05410 [Candidatus Saccharimonadales bacterium]|nr:hypothetical protein [Candidatus Saccharimonadales bacterium]
MEDRILRDIVEKIDSLVSQVNERPSIEVAWDIISVTWGNNVDIMIFNNNYPELIRIADLATDIEAYGEDEEYGKELWNALTFNLDLVKRKLATL